ncbi:MAG TPA: hypothetical protein VF165_17200 [Nocardioidaceae bacterium]
MKIRILTAIALLVSAGTHLRLWLEGYRDIAVIGPAFLLNAVAGVLIAILMLAWRHWVPALLAAGFGASTLGAFLISATVGLFGFREVWTGAAVLTAAVAEVVAVLGGSWALVREYRRRSGARTQDRPAAGGVHLP